LANASPEATTVFSKQAVLDRCKRKAYKAKSKTKTPECFVGRDHEFFKTICILAMSDHSFARLPSIVSGNGFTLEQVLSSPFPYDLVASKSGDKLAWVFDHKENETSGLLKRQLSMAGS
jgi:hypothetical protein